jgi:hypothetical protein
MPSKCPSVGKTFLAIGLHPTLKIHNAHNIKQCKLREVKLSNILINWVVALAKQHRKKRKHNKVFAN